MAFHVKSYFSGFLNKDVAFLHKASKSLIEADLLMNLPPTEQASHLAFNSNLFLTISYQYSKSDISTSKFQFDVGPSSSWLYPRAIWALGRDKE